MKRLIKLNSDNDVLKELKEDLKGEFNAIFLYDKHIHKIENDKIKNKLTEIRNEEKVHAKELEEMINELLNV